MQLYLALRFQIKIIFLSFPHIDIRNTGHATWRPYFSADRSKRVAQGPFVPNYLEI